MLELMLKIKKYQDLNNELKKLIKETSDKLEEISKSLIETREDIEKEIGKAKLEKIEDEIIENDELSYDTIISIWL